MNRLTSKLNPTDATDECHPDIFKADSLKVSKLLFRFSFRAANSLATSIRQSLSVLYLWQRSHVFSLRAEEKDPSPAALVAGFRRRSLHRVMISVIIHFSASESCLILAKMSSKQLNSPSFINTLNISSWTINVLTSTAKKVGGGHPPCAAPEPLRLVSVVSEHYDRNYSSPNNGFKFHARRGWNFVLQVLDCNEECWFFFFTEKA